MKSMLNTTYFGEEAQVFLCAPDGRVIASSDGKKYEKHLLDELTEAGVIDLDAASQVRKIFDNGGRAHLPVIPPVRRTISALPICRKINTFLCRRFRKMLRSA